MSFKVGDDVLCIEEKDIPEFIGQIFRITEIKYLSNGDIDIINVLVPDKANSFGSFGGYSFVFYPKEIVPISTLIKELL